jgi:formylmethanofuran dehydrogenase subunit E
LSDQQEELELAIRDAEKFHGHLGPFLVVGVRLGRIAKRLLQTGLKKNGELEMTVKVPLVTPFSCVIDGIQVTTQCTVGNQKLRILDSQKEISVCFKLQKSGRALRVCVNQETVEDLMRRISEGSSNEELAWKVAQEPESRLFSIEKE